MPMVLQAAVELEVLEIIAKAGPAAQLSAADIASQMGAAQNPDAPSMLDRMLRILVSFSVLTCSLRGTTRIYGLAPVRKNYVRNQNRASFGPLISLIQDKVFMDSWYELKAAILGGGVPFGRVHGTHAFDYPGKYPRLNEVFNKAMINYTTDPNIKQLVDVGGGLGVTLNMITSKYPHVKGINFDQPHVIRLAPSYPGVEHIAGDMFESVPEGDAIFMRWILHDWSDDHCLKLLKNCYKSLPDNGKVIVVEGIIPIIPDKSGAPKAICQQDLLMMTQNPGGKERTEEEFLALATGAGFSGITLECFASNFWVMEFYK